MIQPTPAQTLDNLRTCGGRPSAAWNEILRIMKEVLPGVLALANERFDLRLPNLQGFIVSGQQAPPTGPYFEVGLSTETSPFGHDFEDNSNIVVHIKTEKGAIDRLKLDNLSDMVALARAVFCWYIGPQADEQGRVLWSSLVPTAISLGPTGTMVGDALHLRMTNFPGEGAWTPGTRPSSTDPTPEEVLALLPLCGGRLSLARSAVLDICEKNIETTLPYIAQQTGVRLLQPKSYYALGSEISQSLPAIVVGATATTEGIGFRTFLDRVEISVYCITGSDQSRLGREEHADFAAVVRALLMNYYEGYEDERERWAWTELAPSALSMGQMPWQFASGTVLRYSAIQGPGEKRW